MTTAPIVVAGRRRSRHGNPGEAETSDPLRGTFSESTLQKNEDLGSHGQLKCGSRQESAGGVENIRRIRAILCRKISGALF